MCFVTNYDLVIEKNGRKLEDYESIYEIGLEEYDVIQMSPTLYTDTSTDFHLQRLNYILYEHPAFLNKAAGKHIYNKGEDTIISKDLEKLRDSAKNYFGNLNDARQRMMGFNEPKEETQPTEPKTEQKPTQETNTSKKVPDATSNTNTGKVPTPQKENAQTTSAEKEEQNSKEKIEENLKSLQEMKQKVSEMDFEHFSLKNYPNCAISEDQPKLQRFKCVNSIYRSIYNQKASNNGEILFLEVNTLEGKTVHITCIERGFFINSSTPEQFDPRPSNSYPSFSYTLVGLLSQVSPLFKDNFIKLISQSLNAEMVLFESGNGDKFDWIASTESPLFYSYKFKPFNSEMENMKHMRLNKEWNEEFQTILDINFQNDPLQNLTKEKLLIEFYRMFKETAIEVSY